MALPLFVASHRFDPRSIPGLESWWDAADAASVTLDAGRVSQLADKSGKGRHAANTTSGSTQPSYITGGINGLNVMRLAAASVQRLVVGSSTGTYKFLHDGTQSWVVAVSQYGTVADPNAVYALFGTNTGTSGNVGFVYAFEDRSAVGNNSINSAIFNGTIGSASISTGSGGTIIAGYQNIITPQTTTVQEFAIDAGNATAASRFALRINGGTAISANTSTTAPSTANATGNFTIGALTGLSGPMQGDICEILIFSQQPTAAARDMIRRYLGQKWGVSVA